ncbi:hypothetical protein FB45DRAFT_901283 [Roridomyces roridus]|uniref:NAD-dependent epimerase/dehydratase domain-containing protein n=1 Tax=Roridomyces roridus TaxID=1738132 RepID=A0AAD7CAG7_9AGAR|nr:hypothetical protein FB45DRAFT_901283 [Roridomyces roridus]
MSSGKELIFVTGASGFLGSHVVLQLLQKGYRVRGAARGAKAQHLKSTYAAAGYGGVFEVVKIGDIAHDEFPEALVGVDAVIHVASPLAGREGPEEILKTAVDGTLNVIVQAEKAGVRRMVVTSSIATVWNPEGKWTDKDWNPVTKEQAFTSDNPMVPYAASKKFAELALWEWAEKHPHVEVTTLNPTFFYGPFTPHYPFPSAPDFNSLSTTTMLYKLLFEDGVFPSQTIYIDVRDVAAAHIGALSSPPTTQVGRKRIILSSPTGWPLKKTLDFIGEQRPALKGRLTKEPLPAPHPSDVLPFDLKRVEEVVGMEKADFHTTEQTILDSVDALVAVEDVWRKTGHEIHFEGRRTVALF